jgi:hypothetical protein
MENITTIQKGFNTYKIEIKRFWMQPIDGEFCWEAYKRGKYDTDFQKIPCFTRAEEKHFPDWIAEIATAFLEEYKKSNFSTNT